MKKIILVLGLLLPLSSYAGYVGDVTPSKMFGAGAIKFGVSAPPSDTCDFHSRQFKFDATDEAGKNMLSILLAATMAGKNIDIWYGSSSATGTDETSGCSESNLSVVTAIGLKD